ncbi:MAG: hypothetical protein JO281_18955, partial [Pseudonocardiales bacterium]|nr:hypothetical protein [Pseudonocardiales bacterium]
MSDADISGARHPWVSDGNESILVWVQAQLSEIAKSPGRRFSRIEFDRFMAELAAGSDQSVASEPLRELRAEATAWRERWRLPDVVFLSHRSRHYPKVASFAEQLEAGALDGQPKRNVLVLPPGRLTLDGELLSEGRRWMLLGALDDLLRTCSEMWVWESADYLGSWWTLGELVSASYIDDGEHAPLTIGARRPSDRTPTSADRYRVKLSLQDREHLARYFANSRADQISLELSTVQRVERGIFRAGLGRPYLKIVERILCSDKAMEWQRVAAQLAGICVEEFATLREHAGSFDSYRKRIFHPAYNPRFWKDLLVDRPDTCYELSAQSLIAAESHMLRLDQREVAEAVRSNRRAIARDGT